MLEFALRKNVKNNLLLIPIVDGLLQWEVGERINVAGDLLVDFFSCEDVKAMGLFERYA